MRKTYITNMPNNIGAFLQASKCFALLGINITRVSYNKAVDSHTLFIDVNGDEAALKEADIQLTKIGYLQNNGAESHVVLVEFHVKDDGPGRMNAALELIQVFGFNISYISYQENAEEYQQFRVGLLVEDAGRMQEFLREAEKLYRIRVIDYNRSEKTFDNSIFYNSFVNSLIQSSGIAEEAKEELLINSNLAMQILDEQGMLPYRTFDTISKFAEMLAGCRGEAFSPRITTHKITEVTEITVIEPPCGSNTMIIKSDDEFLFVDSGYAYYKDEMLALIRKLVPEFDSMKKRILITHLDQDHCGLLPFFDEIIASRKSKECLELEWEGKEDYRERNKFHKPYIRICKTLTNYVPADPAKLTVPWEVPAPPVGDLWQIGFFSFGDLNFEVYEGRGGHLPGEIVLIDYEHCIAFTGDIYINIKGMTSEQRRYNQYAPILMGSVDMDPSVSTAERKAVLQRLGAGKWQIFGSHGAKKDYALKISE